jgi:hypothetical protein
LGAVEESDGVDDKCDEEENAENHLDFDDVHVGFLGVQVLLLYEDVICCIQVELLLTLLNAEIIFQVDGG